MGRRFASSSSSNEENISCCCRNTTTTTTKFARFWHWLLLLSSTSQLTSARPSSSSSSSMAYSVQEKIAADQGSPAESLLQWLSFRNDTNYSPLAPASPEALMQLSTEQLMHSNGISLTALNELEAAAAATAAQGRRMRLRHRHRVSASTPFTQRAICPFQFVLNHRPNRVPSTLVEVKCLSPSPSQRLLGRPLPLVECEPMRWTVRTMECQSTDDGRQCTPNEEKIPLACVPVLQATKEKSSTSTAATDDEEADGEMLLGTSAAVVSVPAQAFGDDEMPT